MAMIKVKLSIQNTDGVIETTGFSILARPGEPIMMQFYGESKPESGQEMAASGHIQAALPGYAMAIIKASMDGAYEAVEKRVKDLLKLEGDSDNV